MCIVVVIFLNMIVMAVEHYKQTDAVTDVLSMLNILFVVIFSLEAIVKITGLRWHYFRQPWNVFDFIIVILSLVGRYKFWAVYYIQVVLSEKVAKCNSKKHQSMSACKHGTGRYALKLLATCQFHMPNHYSITISGHLLNCG